MTDNKRYWNEIGITPKEHTKSFTRAGGFSGTAIKPMYSIQRMTEVFGPVGIGWGYSKPEFEVTVEHQGQRLVYCTVGVWYKEGDAKSDLIYGCGGDFAIGSNKSGLRPDDEAFKKAFTDALMNALKHLGMAADVHMGQFDGNKYVQPEPKKDTNRLSNDPTVAEDMKNLGYDAQKVYEQVIEELGTVTDSETLKVWVDRNKETRRMNGMPDDLKLDVKNRHATLKTFFESRGK